MKTIIIRIIFSILILIGIGMMFYGAFSMVETDKDTSIPCYDYHNNIIKGIKCNQEGRNMDAERPDGEAFFASGFGIIFVSVILLLINWGYD